MISDSHDRRLEALIHLLLDGDLPPDAAEELACLLRQSAGARQYYRHALAVHNSLTRLGHSREETPAFSHADIVPMPSPRRRWWIPAAAAAAGVLLAGGLTFHMTGKSPAPLAVLTGMTAATWEEPINLQQALSPGHFRDLTSGFAEVSYQNGVKVILEGPCRFDITGDNSMTVTRGRASVKVPKGVNGFHLDTPGGRLTDLGTEFGVAVGSSADGPVVFSEVFDGEIEIPSGTTRQRLKRGESMAILRETGGTRLASTLEDQPVSVVNPARRLPSAQSPVERGVNLALGKPVFAPSYYTGSTGETFPPDKLTDGRLNDIGSPGDWPFWLAPNGVHGEFTVDLLKPTVIGRIDLQNTRNRNIGDRGLRGFVLLVSDDNRDFKEIARGELKVVRRLPPPGTDIPFESFSFPVLTARYVKLVGLSHYRNESRPASNPNEGGGLNEIRIFSR